MNTIATYLSIALVLQLVSVNLIGQDLSEIEPERLLQTNTSGSQGINLIQFGNQNTAQLIQFQDFEAQLSLYQQGQSNFSRAVQIGSGRISIGQAGRNNRMESLALGENMDIDLYQSGHGNSIRQFSIGNNSNYQLMQNGIENSIEHYNFGQDNAGLQILQRGNDMNIFIYSH